MKYCTKTLPNVFLYIEMIGCTAEFTVTQREDSKLYDLSTDTISAGNTRFLTRDQIESSYFLSEIEARVNWYQDIKNMKEGEIVKLQSEIKRKLSIIRAASKKIDYDNILKEHPDLFV